MNAVFLLLFVALLVNIGHGTKEFSSTVSDRILDVMRRQLPNIIKIEGDEINRYLETPISDTINFETQHVDLCGPILCISANLTKAVLAGLTEYEILKLDFNSDGGRANIDIDMNFSKLQLDADYYTMKGNIMHALPLSGEGKLHFQTTNLRFWTKIVLQVTDHTSIESFENSGFSIDSILSRTEFDGNIDDVFNTMVDELLAEQLNRFNKAIAQRGGAVLKDLINPILKTNVLSYS